MSNLLDYLDWRGDLTFEVAPFNEVDNLIFSIISFVDFERIVPSFENEAVQFSVAMRKYDARTLGRSYLGALIPSSILDLVRKAAKCKRYENIKMIGYLKEIDEVEYKQFCGVCFLLPDGTLYISFEGTDDSIVGWKEDFNLSINAPVPAQKMAVWYLEKVASSLPGKIRIGGHSKGGNLAVWASVHTTKEIQDRIINAYSNDGPGFLPIMFSEEGYLNIKEKIVTFVPQSSIVGTLLEQDENYQVIKSTQTAFMQHDPLSWQVLGTKFVYLNTRSKFGLQTDNRMKTWLERLDFDERKRFTKNLFDVVDATGAKTLTELSAGGIKNIITVLHAFNTMDAQERNHILSVFKKLISK